jgi:UDP-N-acetylglucosamine acyltransferase
LPEIHPTAIVAASAQIAPGCVVGPWCRIGPDVVLEEGVVLDSNVIIDGHTRIGAGTRVWAFAAIGTEPQDLKYKGQPTGAVVGARCTIREGVTINRASVGGDNLTRVGDDCMLMTMAHVAHDCRVGNGVILANNVMLAGHVHIGDAAVLGGGVAVAQQGRVGRLAMVSGMAQVITDPIPFGYVHGHPGRLVGINLVGMRRRGFKPDAVRRMRMLVKLLFRGEEGVFAERLVQARAEFGEHPECVEVLDFAASQRGKRGLMRWGRMSDGEGEGDEAAD